MNKQACLVLNSPLIVEKTYLVTHFEAETAFLHTSFLFN